jgi:hypothetical protein
VTKTRIARVLAAVVLVLAIAACSGSSKSTDSTGAASAPAGDGTTIVLGPDGSSSTVSISGGTVAGGGAATASASSSSTANAVDASGPPGSFAPAILQGTRSSEVVVEVRTQPSAAPQQSSIDHLASVLRSVTGKAVTVANGAGISGGSKAWSADDLRATGAGGAAQGGGRAVIHLLFVHGSFGGDSGVLGVAVNGDTAAVFVDQVTAASTPLIGEAGIESAVVTHEVGHLMGLVDLFLHTGRQDPQHPGHSTNPNSVMYWAVESNVVADVLQGGPPKDFDSADLSDLQTIRNGG